MNIKNIYIPRYIDTYAYDNYCYYLIPIYVLGAELGNIW